MLTTDEKDYLSKIPKDKRFIIKPFNPLALKVARQIINQVHQVAKNLKVIHMGASALKISGQKDIDIYAFSKPKDFAKYLPELIKSLDQPIRKRTNHVDWKWDKGDYQVELTLTDPNSEPMRRQIAVFNALKKNKKLLKKYESLKERFSGKSYKEYQKAKYDFYHQILNKKF